MNSYTYVNGVRVVTTDIQHGFKRFHKCNAQETRFVVNDDNNIPRFEIWQFISYATPIIQVVKDMKRNTWIVSCNDNPFSYSPSTSRQVSKWISEHAFPFNAYDLRESQQLAHPITPDIASYWFIEDDTKITFDFHSTYTFHNVWR